MNSRFARPACDDLARHRVGQRDVGADVEAEPDVRPFGADDVRRGSTANSRAPVADALQQVVEEDRMRLAGVAAPQEDQVRLLDLTV